MNRAAIIATIVASILPFSSPSLAASDADAELGKVGDKMSAAFRCSVYAYMFHDSKEQQRLVRIGLKAGHDYVEGMKTRNDPPTGIMDEMKAYLGEVSTDFVVGAMYHIESANVYIPKYMNPNPGEVETKAQLAYRNSNCSLIQ